MLEFAALAVKKYQCVDRPHGQEERTDIKLSEHTQARP